MYIYIYMYIQREGEREIQEFIKPGLVVFRTLQSDAGKPDAQREIKKQREKEREKVREKERERVCERERDRERDVCIPVFVFK